MKGVIFPGQGSQRPGMAQDFYEGSDKARAVFDKASQLLGIDMPELCFEENELLDSTAYTQIALLTVEMAMYLALRELYTFQADYFAGHSLGELTALCAAEVIPLDDALLLAHKRGMLMQRAAPCEGGAMLALLHEDIEQSSYQDMVKQRGLEIANYNSKKQSVVCGKAEDIRLLQKALLEEEKHRQIKAIPLRVTIPFHSSFLASMEEEYGDYIQSRAEGWSIERASRVLSNFSGAWHKPQELLLSLVKQVSHPVKWIDNMLAMQKQCSVVYEIGPNKILSGFFATLGVKAQALLSLRRAKNILEGPSSG